MNESGSSTFLVDGFPRKLDQLLEFEEKARGPTWASTPCMRRPSHAVWPCVHANIITRLTRWLLTHESPPRPTQIKPCDGVLVFTVPDDVAVERLVKRGESSGRADDNEETIRKRMEVFKEESQPVIDALMETGRVGQIDAQVRAVKWYCMGLLITSYGRKGYNDIT